MSRSNADAKTAQLHELERQLAEAIQRFKTAPDVNQRFVVAAMARAERGDHKAGIEVLRLCAEALDSGQRSPELSTHLRRAIIKIEMGLPKSTTAEQICVLAADALKLRPKRRRGRPRNADPNWEEPLCLFAAILKLRGYRAEGIVGALDEARTDLEGKGLGRTEAQRIRRNSVPLLKNTSERYDDEGNLRPLTTEEWEEDLIRTALSVVGRNAKALQVLLGKYPRMT